MLDHTQCPRCHAPNLNTELMCFACGAALRPLPKRFGISPPAQPPWILWVGLLVGLALAGLVGWQIATWIAGYRARMTMPVWYIPAAGAALVVAGQIGLAEAGRIDRRWWLLKRAPELPMLQCHVGDTVWVRGKIACDSPLIAPYATAECIYYRYTVHERRQGRAEWHLKESGNSSVDFTVAQEEKSLYVPSGGVLWDAQIYWEGFLDDGLRAKVWAIPVGIPISVCGNIAGESDRQRMASLPDQMPCVVTWREPADYIAVTARRARLARLTGWALTILGALALIASVAEV